MLESMKNTFEEMTGFDIDGDGQIGNLDGALQEAEQPQQQGSSVPAQAQASVQAAAADPGAAAGPQPWKARLLERAHTKAHIASLPRADPTLDA